LELTEADVNDEVELEALLKRRPNQIEKGLKVIENQVLTPKGRIDLLCVDTDNILTIVELKVKRDDDHLKQAINYFDWAWENSLWIGKVYPKFKIDSEYYPKIILVAPDFTESVVTGAKYFKEIADIILLKYTVLKHEEKKYVVCTEVKVPDVKETMEKPRTVKDKINYIKVEGVKKACEKTIEEIRNLGSNVEVSVTKSRIVFKYQGRNFASVISRREFFYIEWKEADSWYVEDVKQFGKAEEIINNNVRKAYKLVGGNLPC
jgi:hypothetical protein